MKEPKRITLVLYGLCAVIWTLKVVFSVVYKEYDYFILNALIAIIWIAAFIRWTIRYRSEKSERKKNV